MTTLRIIKASQLSEKDVYDFLKNAHQIDIQSVLKSGYLLEIDGKICGCFVLEEMTDHIFELKKFYLISTEAIKIPPLFEAILTIAKEKKAKKVYVYSQKLMTDIILESFNFYPQEDTVFPKKEGEDEGKWWFYTMPD